MDLFAKMEQAGHEQVIFCYDKASGLKAVIAVHDTTLGPALGGCRMWPYLSEEAVVEDALRLSAGMTYKSAASGQDYGGGKAVIWGDPAQDKSEELLRAFGRFVQTLGGRYITGNDVGTDQQDSLHMMRETEYLAGLPEECGGGGDTAIITAFGVWQGIKACAVHVYGDDSLKGKRVALQGLGKVGSRVLGHLVEDGAEVTITDMQPENLRRVAERYPQVQTVEPGAIYEVPCDIFSPNALGGVLNDETIPKLTGRIVAGAANNQLKEPRHGAMLQQRGILYAPDYVINAGGLIQVADELQGFNRERAFRKTAAIYGHLQRIFAISEAEGVPTSVAADRLAERRISRIAQVRRTYVPE